MIRRFLMAMAMICALSLGFTGCSDEDEENGNVKSWSTLCDENSWLDAFPRPARHYATDASAGLGSTKGVTVVVKEMTKSDVEDYRKKVLKDGFVQKLNTDIYVKMDENVTYTATITWAEVDGHSVGTFTYTKSNL